MEADQRPSESPESRASAADRRVIAMVVALSVSLMLVAVAQTFSASLRRTIRHFFFRTDPPPGNATSTALASAGAGTTVSISGADAQIVPPRSRSVAHDLKSPMPPVHNEPAPVAVLPNVANAQERALPTAEPEPPPVSAERGMRVWAERQVRLAWKDFHYPVQLPSDLQTWHAYQGSRTRLLKAVALRTPSALSLEQACKAYAGACSEFDDDPRLDYAFGLMLWRHGRPEEAIRAFRSAGRLDTVPFLPAALAEAWAHFLNSDPRRGLHQLALISRVVAQLPDAYPPESVRVEACVRIGRAFGYLDETTLTAELRDVVNLTLRNVEQSLSDQLRVPLWQGREEVRRHRSELLSLNSDSERVWAAEQARDEQRIRDQLNELRQAMTDASHELARQERSDAKAARDLNKEGMKLRTQLQRIPGQLQRLAEQAWQLTRPEDQFRTSSAPQHYHSLPGPDGKPVVVMTQRTLTYQVAESAEDQVRRRDRGDQVRAQREQLRTKLDELRARYQESLARRDAAEQDQTRMQRAAQQTRAERRQELRELEQELAALDRDFRRVQRLRAGLDTLAAHVPWDPEIEAAALGECWRTER